MILINYIIKKQVNSKMKYLYQELKKKKKNATVILEKSWASLKKETILSSWHDALLKHIKSSNYDWKGASEVLSNETFRKQVSNKEKLSQLFLIRSKLITSKNYVFPRNI